MKEFNRPTMLMILDVTASIKIHTVTPSRQQTSRIWTRSSPSIPALP